MVYRALALADRYKIEGKLMQTLFTILAVLFLALFIVVKLTERYSKPMDAEEGNRYSKIIIVLLVILAVAQIIKFSMGS